MEITKLTSTDAFVVVDLEGAARSTGIVRWARKVLQDGAVNLARHRTYAYAALGIEAGGASAGVNSDPDGRAAAIAAFVAEAASGGVRFDAGKGVSPEDLEPLSAGDDRSAVGLGAHDQLIAAGAFAALDAAVGVAEGITVAIEGAPPGGPELAERLQSAGCVVTFVEGGVLDASADVLCVGSKVGAIDHLNAPSISARTVVPLTPLPITARGLATAARAGVAVLPDFVTLAGPLTAHWPADASVEALVADASTRIGQVVTSVLDHPEGPLLGACEAAEAFLLTWRDALPFGRPIA